MEQIFVYHTDLLQFCTGTGYLPFTNGVVVALENDLLYELPETGGSGTYWYTVSGALLMMGAALIVYRQKRKREVLLRK